MKERSKLISKMLRQRPTRESYVRSKPNVLIPSQIRSLRQRRGMKQCDLGVEADMKQARISALERIGESNLSIETLIRLAAAFRTGLIVKFAPHSEMLDWENSFSPDTFESVSLDRDDRFLRGEGPRLDRPNPTMSLGLQEALTGGNKPRFGLVSSALEGASFNDRSFGASSFLGEPSDQDVNQRGNAA